MTSKVLQRIKLDYKKTQSYTMCIIKKEKTSYYLYWSDTSCSEPSRFESYCKWERSNLLDRGWLQLRSDNVTVVYDCKNSAGRSLNPCECRTQQHGGEATLGHTRPTAHLPWLDAHRTTVTAVVKAFRLTLTHWKVGNPFNFF